MRVISFIGLDGSGKTTQATRFAKRRQEERIDARYEHQFRFRSERAMRWKARARPLLLAAQGATCEQGTVVMAPNAARAERRGKLERTILKALVAPPLALVVIALGLWRTWTKSRAHREREILVTDRHFIDELVRVEWKLGVRLPFPSLWLSLCRVPDFAVYFDIPGEVSWERMDPQDSSPDAMRRKEAAYRRWLPRLARRSRLVVLPIAGKSIEEVAELVESAYASPESAAELEEASAR